MLIENNIPLPESTGGVRKYPFHSMAVGDSFTLPRDVKYNLQMAAYAHSKRHNKKFSVRNDSDDNLVRCWRIE